MKDCAACVSSTIPPKLASILGVPSSCNTFGVFDLDLTKRQVPSSEFGIGESVRARSPGRRKLRRYVVLQPLDASVGLVPVADVLVQ